MTDKNDLKIKSDTKITGILKETGSVPSEAGAIDASGSGISVSSPVTAPEPGRRALSLRKGKDINVELLRVIACLMVIVTHEMAFARDVSSQVLFMDEGRILEQGTPQEVLENPREERTKQFLSRFTQG